MPDHLYRLPMLICCDTCGREFFGKSGEADARQHATDTFHQVRINALVRETLNQVSEGQVPTYVSSLDVSTPEQLKGRAAAEARLVVLCGDAP